MKCRFRSLTGLAAALAVVSAPALAETYAIDPDHTEVRFTWDHLGLSRQGGRFTSVFGQVKFNPENPAESTVDVTIPLKSIATGVRKLDEQLVGTKDFFDIAAHPDISFRSTGVALKSDRTADVTGNLTMNGISKPVVLDVIWNFTGDHPLQSFNPAYAGTFASGFSATTQIRRSDWGITRGAPLVSDEIRITIETEMHRVGGPAGEASGANLLKPPMPEAATETGLGAAADGAAPLDPLSQELSQER